jgi:hypothetical protein
MQNIVHYPVTAEHISDEHGPLIVFTQQEGIDDACTVSLHPFQLKSILTQFGLIAADHEAEKTIATLERRLMVLRDRVDDLHYYLCNNPDLALAAAHAAGTMVIANEFCHGLETPAHGLRQNMGHNAAATKCNPAPEDKQNTMGF